MGINGTLPLRQRVITKIHKMVEGRFVAAPSDRLFIASGKTLSSPDLPSVVGIYCPKHYPKETKETITEKIMKESREIKRDGWVTEVGDAWKNAINWSRGDDFSRTVDRMLDGLLIDDLRNRCCD